jgi:hypothetical protein
MVDFILAHWEDIVIAFSVAFIFLLIDLFIKRRRTEDEAFDATDRLISYYLAAGIVIFALLWLNEDPMRIILIFIVGLGYLVGFLALIDQRKKKN